MGELEEQIRLARAGDREALGYLVAAGHELASRVARSLLVDRHRAEDAAQEGLWIALERLDELREPGAFYGWLSSIVRRQAWKQLRLARGDLLDDPQVLPASEAFAPPQRAQRAELRDLVRDAVAGLTPATRAVSERYYLQGLSLNETADALGIPSGTVKRRLYEARERLRIQLAGVGRPLTRHEEPPRRRRLRRPL